MRQVIAAVAIVLSLATAALCTTVQDSREIFRLRVENSAGGRVQVSIDSGVTYKTVGAVSRPASRTMKGFAASSYTPNRTVAATAVHGIRVKTCTRNGDPMTISLVSSEFVTIPEGYGGYIAYDSGIYTDIPTGTSIFRNFAPFVGNPARLEVGGKLVDFPQNWQPKSGDVIVITAMLPKPYLKQVIFENHVGGAITATYDDGTEKAIGKVLTRLEGVGRFDATSYTGEGLINTNHGGVITVSTAAIAETNLLEGAGYERRGGFQIQPSEHFKTQIPMPQTMAVAPIMGEHHFEGWTPLFSGYIGLAFDPKNPDNSMRAEMGFADGSWQPMPDVLGKEDDIFRRLRVTRIRLLFPRYSAERLAESLENAAARPRGRTVKGFVKLQPGTSVDAGAMVLFIIDGQVKGITNQSPYRLVWNTSDVSNGQHEVEIRINDSFGTTIRSEKRRIVVWNPN